MEVDDKRLDIATIRASSWRENVDSTLQEKVVVMGPLRSIVPSAEKTRDLSNEVKAHTNSLVALSEEDSRDPDRIYAAISGVGTNLAIPDPEAHVLTY